MQIYTFSDRDSDSDDSGERINPAPDSKVHLESTTSISPSLTICGHGYALKKKKNLATITQQVVGFVRVTANCLICFFSVDHFLFLPDAISLSLSLIFLVLKAVIIPLFHPRPCLHGDGLSTACCLRSRDLLFVGLGLVPDI